MFDLDGKSAIVTGGGAGLGRAYALALAEAGASVMVVDTDHTAADNVAQEIAAAEGVADSAKIDVANRQDTESMAKLCVETFGRIDILITNAGVTSPAMIHKMTQEQWDQVVSVNQTGVFKRLV